MARVTVVDASVLIAHLDAGDALHTRATAALAETDGPLFVSALTLAEVLVGPARRGRLAETHAVLRGPLGVQAVPFDEHAPVRLAELRAATGLRLPDCAVLLAAELAAPAALLTFDARLARAAAELGLGAN